VTPKPTSLLAESIAQGDFYVPRFQVKIAGAGLPRDVLYDVRKLVYTDSIDTIDGFQMEINNWDDTAREFKYIGSETDEQLQPGKDKYAQRTLFEPCGKEVEVLMGYGDNLVPMLKGHFTTMQPSFVDGAPILSVTGLNVLHQLRRKPYTTAWTISDQHKQGWKDSEIALNLNKLTDGGKSRFPLPIQVDKTSMANDEKPQDLVTQNNQTDIEFLLQRARLRGYVVAIKEGKAAGGKTERYLYFGPSGAAQNVEYRLSWGQTLMEFKPKLSTANQVRSVTVNGWERNAKKPITRKASIDFSNQKFKVNGDLYRILNQCDPHEDIVVDEPVFHNCDALKRAQAILKDQVKQIVTAENVKVVGLPNLRSGRLVTIDHVGSRLSGEYFVTKTTHTIDDNGYITTFDCRREQYPGGRPGS
jgi:phage protein D